MWNLLYGKSAVCDGDGEFLLSLTLICFRSSISGFYAWDSLRWVGVLGWNNVSYSLSSGGIFLYLSRCICNDFSYLQSEADVFCFCLPLSGRKLLWFGCGLSPKTLYAGSLIHCVVVLRWWNCWEVWPVLHPCDWVCCLAGVSRPHENGLFFVWMDCRKARPCILWPLPPPPWDNFPFYFSNMLWHSPSLSLPRLVPWCLDLQSQELWIKWEYSKVWENMELKVKFILI